MELILNVAIICYVLEQILYNQQDNLRGENCLCVSLSEHLSKLHPSAADTGMNRMKYPIFFRSPLHDHDGHLASRHSPSPR